MQSNIDYFNETAAHSRNLEDFFDPGAKRDPPIYIVDQVFESVGSELGFFYFLMLGCIFFLLNQVDGKIFRIKIFLMNRDFNLVENDGLIVFVNFILRILSWISMLMPFMSLAVWTAGLIIRALDFGLVPVGGICVLMVGLAFFWFILGIFKIKWNNFQYTNFNGLCLGLAFLFLMAYQFVAVFLDNQVSFFGFSAIFLCANCMIMILCLYLNMGISEGSIREVLLHKLEKGEPRDPNRETDFMEELNEEKADKQYVPTYEDIVDLFTIAKIREQ